MADAPAPRPAYALLVYTAPTTPFAAATAPLWASFGDDLTLWRDGDVVHWSYDGQTVIVSQHADGGATASFVDAPMLDHVSGASVTAVYRRTTSRCYQFTAESCKAMVADMIAFFSGEREPLFTFTGARSL